MSNFDWPRFERVFCNDLLQQWKRIWIATLALAGTGLIAYLTNVDPQAAVRPALYALLFPVVLIGGGLIFTSTIFSDLHHPLQRFHYLTLPCSSLERFLSRYLLSAPLYYLHVLVAYAVFDRLAAAIAGVMMDKSAAAFAPFEPRMLQLTLAYFGLHALMFGGAIYFRSHALIKTMLCAALIGFGLVLAQLAAVRIFFWDYFPTLWPVETTAPIRLFVLPQPVQAGAWILLCLWGLFIAYRCLREHEVQREL
jgi:hypothetical protein